jgi:hypothetical protein
MKRRQFIQLSAVGGTVMLVTGISCSHHHTVSADLLSHPEDLAQICDLKTLREIGMAYHQQAASEMETDKLTDLLLTDSAGRRLPPDADPAAVQTLISTKIKEDFELGKTVLVKGWILSVTEARQCALLFVNNP